MSSSTPVAVASGGGVGRHPKTHCLKYEKVVAFEEDHSEETVDHDDFEDDGLFRDEDDIESEDNERDPLIIFTRDPRKKKVIPRARCLVRC